MIASLTLSEPFDAGSAVVCTALFSRCTMPCPRVRQYARLLGLRLAPTIQSEGEEFQRVELEYDVSNR